MKTVKIGAGAGYAGDTIEGAVELAEKGDIQYLCFECLAERTIAMAQQAKLKDPSKGYNIFLEDRMEAVLPICSKKGIKIITNMGAANPLTAAQATKEVAQKLGIKGLKIAAVTGDNVLAIVQDGDYTIMETGENVNSIENKVSANAYLGVEPITEALANGVDIVITGRVADPSLFLAPLVHEFKWSLDNWELLGKGTIVGHLLECGGQVTGGIFADPGYKDVPGLARIGHPIAEVSEDGTIIITKVMGSGGIVTPATCKEQMLYELHDPASYITPDVVADFSNVTFKEVGKDRVLVEGANGRARTDYLKVSIGYIDSYIGEGQLSYAGAGAVGRGRLGLEIVAERIKIANIKCQEVKFDLIGVDSLHGSKISALANKEPYEVRIRVAARTENMKEAARLGNEVERLALTGPYGGGGLFSSAKEVVAVLSTLIPRHLTKYDIQYEVI